VSFFPLRIYQNRCRCPHWGAYSAPQTHSRFQGDPLAAGGEWRGGEGRTRGEGKRKRESKGGMGKGGKRGNLGE